MKNAAIFTTFSISVLLTITTGCEPVASVKNEPKPKRVSRMEQMQRDYLDATTQVDVQNTEIEKLKEEIEVLKQQLVTAESENQSLVTEIAKSKQHLAAADQSFAKITEELAMVKAALAKVVPDAPQQEELQNEAPQDQLESNNKNDDPDS